MHEQYWKMLWEQKHFEQYFWHYNIWNTRRLIYVNALLIAASIFNLAYALAIADLNRLGIIIHIALAVLCQTAILCWPLSQMVERKIALKYFVPELMKHFDEISVEWISITNGKYSDDEIESLIMKYSKKYSELTATYAPDYPISRESEEFAEAQCKNYFKYHFDSQECAE